MKFCSACDLAAHAAIEAGLDKHGCAWFEMCEPCHETYLDEMIECCKAGDRWWAILPGHVRVIEFSEGARHLFTSRRMRVAMQLDVSP